MKILWVCNVPIEPIAIDMNKKIPVSSGWVMGLYNQIIQNKEYELCIAFPLPNEKSMIQGTVGQVKYYSFYQKTNIVGLPDFIHKNKITRQHIRNILDKTLPDLLYIFGTEYVHSVIAVEEFNNPSRTIINIQGLVSIISEFYYADLKKETVKKFVFSNIFRGSIYKQKKSMYLRGLNERDAIKKVSHVVGRTNWDRACTREINHNIIYHCCNESLRDVFYNPPRLWDYFDCEKHSIFVSQANYPIKGFHYLLEALKEVRFWYPDVQVYVAGNAPVKGKGIKNMLAVSSYGVFLNKRIKELNVQDHIHFCGRLDQNMMVEQYLKANVFVLPSIIENSPNSLGEAMILRVPCVVSDVGGVKSLVKHGEEALLYQHNETRMLADCIMRVFEQKEKIIEMAQRGYSRAICNHDKIKNCDDVLKIYDEVNKDSM